MKEYFTKTYEESRSKILEFSEAKSGNHIAYELGNKLFLDYIHFNPEAKNKLLLFIIGDHGVEGYLGSAFVQLFLDKFYPDLKKDTSLAALHGMNADAMSKDRRVGFDPYNEKGIYRNIDLSRAFFTTKEEYVENDPEISKIFDELESAFIRKQKRKSDLLEMPRYYLLALWFIKKYGFHKVKQAGAGAGQYHKPETIMYGGNSEIGPPEPVKIYRNILKDISEGVENLILIDLHSGYPKTLYMAEHRADSPEFKRWKEVTTKAEALVTDEQFIKRSLFPKREGTPGLYAGKHSLAKNTYAMVTDWGTSPYNKIKLGYFFAKEMQVREYGAESKTIEEMTRAQFREIFYPSSLDKRKSLVKEADEFFESLCRVFNL